jgi:hypothetical protein
MAEYDLFFNLEYNKERISPTQASSLILHREEFQNQQVVFLLSKLFLDLPNPIKTLALMSSMIPLQYF